MRDGLSESRWGLARVEVFHLAMRLVSVAVSALLLMPAAWALSFPMEKYHSDRFLLGAVPDKCVIAVLPCAVAAVAS